MQWTVLVPVRGLANAKTRLLNATDDQGAHERLVAAIRTDTVQAALSTAHVARVVSVLDTAQTPPAPHTEVFLQRATGLNPALAEAAAYAGRRWPQDGVAALVADLPCLSAADLQAALIAAVEHPRCFVADAAGTGTTLLTAHPGFELAPRFGVGSAAQHGIGAAALPAAAGLRRDVDTAEDLADAMALGVGPATAEVLRELSIRNRAD